MATSEINSERLLARLLSDPNSTLRELDRLDCQTLSGYVRRAWHIVEPGAPYVHGWHIDAMCDHLEAVTRGNILRLLINVPPGAMKSLLTGVFWQTWEWGPENLAHHRFVATAHKEPLAIRDNLKARRLVSSEWYQGLWGDRVQLTGDQNAKTKFENTRTGFREASAFNSLTGARGDRVLIDDPHSVDDASSDAKRETAVTTFLEAVPTRLNSPERSAIVVIMQRLHERDVSGEIIARNLGYEHLMLPMEFEASRRCRTSIGFTDPRMVDGELLFPARFPREVVDRDKRVMGEYAVAGQFQQRPAPRGGAIFKASYIKTYEGDPPAMRWRAIYADTAMKAKEENDYSVFQEWGLGVDGRPYILGQVRGKWEAPELETVARSLWNAARLRPVNVWGTLRVMAVEDKVSGTGLIQKLTRDRIPIRGIQRDKDKIQRANDVAPYLAVNPIMISDVAEFGAAYTEELLSFPRGANDDQVDPTVDAIKDLLARSADYSAWVG